jgi:hypothetical protein
MTANEEVATTITTRMLMSRTVMGIAILMVMVMESARLAP